MGSLSWRLRAAEWVDLGHDSVTGGYSNVIEFVIRLAVAVSVT
jgi:hypothetical protein